MICVFSRYNISSLEGGEGSILRGEALITMLLVRDDRRCVLSAMETRDFFLAFWIGVGALGNV